MLVETRPTLGGLSDDQREIALAHWHLFVCIFQGHVDDTEATNGKRVLSVLEQRMQPETLHRLAIARGRYYRECDTQHKLTPTSIDSR